MKVKNFLTWLFGRRYLNLSKTKQMRNTGIIPVF